jgi:hypothetical protein
MKELSVQEDDIFMITPEVVTRRICTGQEELGLDHLDQDFELAQYVLECLKDEEELNSSNENSVSNQKVLFRGESTGSIVRCKRKSHDPYISPIDSKKKLCVRKEWSKEEDEELAKALSKYCADHSLSMTQLDQVNWKQLPKYANKNILMRSTKQIRERYMFTLNPLNNRKPWSLEEDCKLIKIHKTHGNCWNKIAKEMNAGRTEKAARVRYQALRKCQTKLFFPKHDEALKELNKQCHGDMTLIQQEFTNKFPINSKKSKSALINRIGELNQGYIQQKLLRELKEGSPYQIFAQNLFVEL